MRPRSLTLVLLVLASASSLAIVPRAALATAPGENGLIAFERRSVNDVDIWTVESDGSNLTQITSGPARQMSPAWSPDGTKIVFEDDTDGGLSIMNADGSNVQEIPGTSGAYGPSWSPDGTEIVFGKCCPSGQQHIATIKPDGTQLTVLTSGDVFDEDPEWSPDGAKIVFARHTDPSTSLADIAVVNVTTKVVTVLTETNREETPTWSPDGAKIAFTSRRGDGWSGLWVMNADGSNEAVVSFVDFRDSRQPSWSPDGSKIVFNSSRDFSDELWMVDVDGSNPVRITDTPPFVDELFDWNPAWQSCPSGGCSNTPEDAVRPSSRVSRPRNGLSYIQANLTSVTGTATDSGGSGVAKVQIALRRYLTDGRCANWNGSRFVLGTCNLRLWKDAAGTGTWTYTLPRVLTKSKGTSIDHYLVMSRAVDVAGNTETLLTNGRNRNSFEVI